MRKWMKAFSIPAVANDKTERTEALQASTRNVRQVRAGQCSVDAVADSIQRHVNRNHFIERLEMSYGLRR